MHTQIANLKKLRAQYQKEEETSVSDVKPIPTHQEIDMKMK